MAAMSAAGGSAPPQGDVFDQLAAGQTAGPPASPTGTAPPSGDVFDQLAAGKDPDAVSAASSKGFDIDNPLKGSSFDPDQQLTSYGAATRGAVGGVLSDTLRAVHGAVKMINPKPQNPEEETALATGGVGAVFVHRLLEGGKSTFQDATQVAAAIHEINQSKDPVGTYLQVAQKTASQGAGQALTALATEGVAKGAGAVAGRAAEAAGTAGEGARNLGREIVQGKEIAQPGAQEAIRRATGAAPGVPIVSGAEGTSVMDDTVTQLDKMRQDLYRQASDKAGFDVQQAKEQLGAAQTRLKLTEGTESTDIAQQARQQISELQEKLASAEENDPALMKAADQAHSKYAGAIQFRKALVRATDVDGTVDVPKLLTASKNLRFTKWGDQLGSFMGKAQADEYMGTLEKMRDMGAHAVKVQNLAKWVGKVAGAGILLEGGNAVRGALTQ
jgi:hypothetical protein